MRAALRDAREAAVHETGGMTAADARARMLPSAYVRLHSPPRVPLELTGAARNAAVALALVRRISAFLVAACGRGRQRLSMSSRLCWRAGVAGQLRSYSIGRMRCVLPTQGLVGGVRAVAPAQS